MTAHSKQQRRKSAKSRQHFTGHVRATRPIVLLPLDKKVKITVRSKGRFSIKPLDQVLNSAGQTRPPRTH
jgi:hypothetical protein